MSSSTVKFASRWKTKLTFPRNLHIP